MTIAVLSDIHGNLESWHAVLEDIQSFNVDDIYCLGDVIGYGADPYACIASVQKNCSIILQGNHENALLNPVEQSHMNSVAQTAITWTAQQLPEKVIETISSWPLVKVGTDARLVHGSPDEPLAFHYITYRMDVENAFRAFSEKVCFYGHTHWPAVAEEIVSNTSRVIKLAPRMLSKQKEEQVISLDEKTRYLISVGSVGQPRDGDARARWVLVKSDPSAAIFRYVPYDIEKAQQKILKAGLPEILAERLKYGK